MRNISYLISLVAFFIVLTCCNNTNSNSNIVDDNISFAEEQYGMMIDLLEDSARVLIPKSIIDGEMKFIPPNEWTSGFFAGSLWYLYELTGNQKWIEPALKQTEALEEIQYYTGNHDVGFMIGCSYGNALRLTGNEEYQNVIIQAAKSLISRFNPTTGLIQSWNANKSRDWDYPVIIDNMMNLEILFDATEYSGDSTFYNVAVSHADLTIENHYRPDYSTWHVVDYNTEDGSVRHKNTHQGYSDDSSWSRGQSWGIYGYILCYRKTGNNKYLDQAEKALEFIANHPNYPEDGVPYWDYNSPDIPETYRDVSSASILASALYEISTYSDKMDYKGWADKIINSLSGPEYRAEVGENGYFLLKHSVGSLPHNAEVDVPLNYADYYFLEALTRKREIESLSADVIIYGGTSVAVISAVEIIQSGKSVIIVSPDKHLGGLSSSGLGYTDSGNTNSIGGLSRDFYHRIWQHYNNNEAWQWEKKEEYGNIGQGTPAMDGENKTMWIFEPHVAEKVFEDYIREYKISVFRDEWLDRESGVMTKDGKIESFTTISGKKFSGKMFIDATYEGDLMAAAGVSYTVGREPCSQYNEQWNGVQEGVYHHGHFFKTKISPYIIPDDPSSGLLPFISSEPIQPNCSGDSQVQAYCFRMCMSNHPDNRVPFEKPDNYNPMDYELLARVFETGWNEWFDKYDIIPNRKTDTNNHGPFSTDFIGMNYDYPEASYERRKEIIEEHKNYQKGLFYFVSTNERVPEDVRNKMNEWGLAKDEFADNDNWPYQLYIREARRMIGSYVTTENEVLGKVDVKDPIGMGSYTLDSHNTQRFVTSEGYVQNEGDVGVKPEKPYKISYGSIIPKKEECTNLLVPVCLSSSHIAFGSIRMEPVFMILGHSAAAAASIAIDDDIAVQDIDYVKLKEKLLKENQILETQ